MIEPLFVLVGIIIGKGLLEFFLPPKEVRTRLVHSILEACSLALFVTLSFRFGILEGEEVVRTSGLTGRALYEAKEHLRYYSWMSVFIQLAATLGMFVAVALIYLKPAIEVASQESDGA